MEFTKEDYSYLIHSHIKFILGYLFAGLANASAAVINALAYKEGHQWSQVALYLNALLALAFFVLAGSSFRRLAMLVKERGYEEEAE